MDLKNKPLTLFSSGLTAHDKQILIEKIEYELLFSDSVVVTITKKKRGGDAA